MHSWLFGWWTFHTQSGEINQLFLPASLLSPLPSHLIVLHSIWTKTLFSFQLSLQSSGVLICLWNSFSPHPAWAAFSSCNNSTWMGAPLGFFCDVHAVLEPCFLRVGPVKNSYFPFCTQQPLPGTQKKTQVSKGVGTAVIMKLIALTSWT